MDTSIATVSTNSTVNSKNNECAELKNIKYKTMIINGLIPSEIN